jgi:glycosyltransferase involved in cell wall biosynthesis
MQRLKATGRSVTLELIGGFETTEYQRHIMGMVEELKLHDVVEWTGFTSDVPEAIRRLDALVLPSLFGEGMPMVVLEALSAAVPVVATSVEGTPEVVRDGVEGVLAEPQSAESLVKKIEELISNRSRWIEMSDRAMARHRAEFSDVRMAGGVAATYDRVLHDRVSQAD